MRLFRTIVYTLLILALLIVMIVRHNRQKASTPRGVERSAVTCIATASYVTPICLSRDRR